METVGDLIAALSELSNDTLISAECEALGQEFSIESISLGDGGAIAVIKLGEV